VRNGGSYALWVAWGAERATHPSNYDIYYKYFYEPSPSNWQWSNEVRLAPASWDYSGMDQEPSIIQTQDGTIWVAWCSDVDSDYDIYLTRSIDFGATWEQPYNITNNQNTEDMYPSITRIIDNTANEYIWIAWHSNSDGDDEIYYTELDPVSMTRGSILPLTQNEYQDRHSTIMQTNNGNIWIAWDRLTAANSFEVYYTFTSNWGASWSTPVDITNDSHVDQTPWLTQTWDGKVWVVWATDRAGNLEIYTMCGVQP